MNFTFEVMVYILKLYLRILKLRVEFYHNFLKGHC